MQNREVKHLRPLSSATPRDYQYAIDSWQALNSFAVAAAMAADRPVRGSEHQPNTSLPVILLTGFLGSGKTTLLNRLLQEPGGRSIAAIVNDFGALNIDADLIERREGDLISLQNGCVCCTPSGGITQALLDLTTTASHLDTIIIETSGVADPLALTLPIAAVPGVRLDGVITVIDAASLNTQLKHDELHTLITRQVAAADLILLNKIDQTHPDDTVRAIEWVRQTAPSAAVLRTQYADVPPALALGLDEPHALTAPVLTASHAEFRALTFGFHHPIDRRLLTTWLQTIPTSILRLKGFICVVDDGVIRSVVVQSVGRRYTLEETDRATGIKNRLVAIGLTADLDDVAITRWATAAGAEQL